MEIQSLDNSSKNIFIEIVFVFEVFAKYYLRLKVVHVRCDYLFGCNINSWHEPVLQQFLG